MNYNLQITYFSFVLAIHLKKNNSKHERFPTDEFYQL